MRLFASFRALAFSCLAALRLRRIAFCAFGSLVVFNVVCKFEIFALAFTRRASSSFAITFFVLFTISFVLTMFPFVTGITVSVASTTGTGCSAFAVFVFFREVVRNCTGSATLSRLSRSRIAVTMSSFFAPSTMTAFTFLATDFNSPMVEDFLKSTL